MIRPFQHSDLEIVKEIFQENVPQYFTAKELDDLVNYLTEYGNTYFLIEENGKILGCGGYHFPKPNKARLSWDFFRVEAKGKGLGRKLIQHCLDEIAEHPDISKIEVWTSQFAYGFYGKFGFETVKREPDYWGKGLDLYLMEKG